VIKVGEVSWASLDLIQNDVRGGALRIKYTVTRHVPGHMAVTLYQS
jgi:hypothetical protein